jgi:hypothetical protein
MSAVAGWAWTVALLAVILMVPTRVLMLAILALVVMPAALVLLLAL